MGLVAAAANTQRESELAPPAKKHIQDRSLQSSTACPTEYAACESDASWVDCYNHFISQYDGCFEYQCEDSQTEFCCALAGEEDSSANDVALGNYVGE